MWPFLFQPVLSQYDRMPECAYSSGWGILKACCRLIFQSTLALKSTLNTLGWKDCVTQDHIKVVWTASHDSFAVVSYGLSTRSSRLVFFFSSGESCNLSRAFKGKIQARKKRKEKRLKGDLRRQSIAKMVLQPFCAFLRVSFAYFKVRSTFNSSHLA